MTLRQEFSVGEDFEILYNVFTRLGTARSFGETDSWILRLIHHRMSTNGLSLK